MENENIDNSYKTKHLIDETAQTLLKQDVYSNVLMLRLSYLILYRWFTILRVLLNRFPGLHNLNRLSAEKPCLVE